MEFALFSPSSLFHDDDATSSDNESVENSQNYVERSHQFPGMELVIREFSFHQMNANLLWPGTFAFAEWLVQDKSRIERRHILELGSGTGALAIFLKKLCQVDITTSDYDDQEIEENIAHNCRINGVIPVLPHIKHSWGDPFPNPHPEWDLIIASDILLYVKQYANLIKTLCFLLNSYKPREAAAVPHEPPQVQFEDGPQNISSILPPNSSLSISPTLTPANHRLLHFAQTKAHWFCWIGDRKDELEEHVSSSSNSRSE